MPDSVDIHLIVGLGNPGKAYEKTRHNVGFSFVDALAEQARTSFVRDKALQGELCAITLAARKLWLFKPTTFMNLSGNAVQAVLHYYRLQTQQMLVVHDELDLPPGQAKLKFSGGHAGHNGLRSIHSHVGPDYWRLRLGIGHPGHKAQVAQWVLDQASLPDRQAIESSLLHCVQHLPVLCQGDLALAQRLLHTSP